MESLFDQLRWIHIGLGFTGLVAFWIPAAARKGSPLHVRAGRVFEWAAYVVAGTAIFNALGRMTLAVAQGARFEDNRAEYGFLVFLAYLGLVTLATVRHGVRSVRVKGDYARLRSPAHFSLAVVSIAGSLVVVGYAILAWTSLSIILLALSPIGIGQGGQMIRRMRTPPPERMGWFYAHMGNMIGAGIAFHTAFLVFGSARFFDLGLSGSLNFLPWVLPAVIGITANRIVERKYRRRFGDLPARKSGARATA